MTSSDADFLELFFPKDKQPQVTSEQQKPKPPTQDVYHSPNLEIQKPQIAPVIPTNPQQPNSVIEEKKALFIDFSWKGIKLSREHKHSPRVVKVKICKDCGELLGGEKCK